MKLMVILGSSRHGRRGEVVSNWVRAKVQEDGRFEIDFADTQTLGLRFFDEPLSPFAMRDTGQKYTHPEGETWASRIGEAECFIIVTPEYNHGYTGVLKNALDWVGREWGDKPVAFVSYSSQITGGARAVEQLRPVVTELGLIQVANAIHIPRISEAFGDNGEPLNERANESLKKMFNELERLKKAFN